VDLIVFRALVSGTVLGDMRILNPTKADSAAVHLDVKLVSLPGLIPLAPRPLDRQFKPLQPDALAHDLRHFPFLEVHDRPYRFNEQMSQPLFLGTDLRFRADNLSGHDSKKLSVMV
jgi:hypothetical protein